MANEIMITVDGVAMPCPSTFIYGLQDVSSGESGRDENAYMYKNRIAQKVKIQLGWNALQWSEVASIMQAFNPEYVSVKYPDMKSGLYETRTFYVGDRSAPVKCWWVGNKLIESVTFDIIER